MEVVPSDENELVNRIRAMVKRWRDEKYPDATAATRQLLFHWRSETNEPRLFFAQVEAAETLIWLTEGNASRYPVLAEIRRELADANGDYNAGIYRLAVRMATGSGKTAVMGMVIAWHAVNAAATLRKDDRYTTLFLAMTPGHTVRERLLVLEPSHPNNVYDEMRLLPESKRSVLEAVRAEQEQLALTQLEEHLAEQAAREQQLRETQPVGAHNSVVGADQGFRAPSGDQASVRDSGHEDSASARIAAGQRPRPSFRHPHPADRA